MRGVDLILEDVWRRPLEVLVGDTRVGSDPPVDEPLGPHRTLAVTSLSVREDVRSGDVLVGGKSRRLPASEFSRSEGGHRKGVGVGGAQVARAQPPGARFDAVSSTNNLHQILAF